MPQLVYIRWVDANYQPGEHEIETTGEGVVLEHYGVLIRETRNGVAVSTEVPIEKIARNPFTILRKNILEMKLLDAEEAFAAAPVVYPKRRSRKTQPQPQLEPANA